MTYPEPKIFSETKTFGNLTLLFEGEKYPGNEILDTKVSISGHTLCWITWSEKDEFAKQLENTVLNHRI